MNTDLKDCPFCGGSDFSEIRENGKIWLGVRYSDPTSYSIYHYCNYEKFSTTLEIKGKTKEEAINRWNTRI